MSRLPFPKRALQSIRVRILGAYFIAILAMLASVTFLVQAHQDIGHTQSLVTDTYLKLASTADVLQIYQERADQELDRQIKSTPLALSLETSTAKVYTTALESRLDEALIFTRHASEFTNNAEERIHLKKIEGQVERLRALFLEYEEGSNTTLASLRETGVVPSDDALRSLTRQRTALADELDRFTKTVEGRIEVLIKTTHQMRLEANETAAKLTGTAMLISIIMLIAVLYALRPITRLTLEVQRLARGEFSNRVEVSGASEVATLAREFNAMADAVQERDHVLSASADELRKLTTYLVSVLDSLEDALVVVEDGDITLANPAAHADWDASRGAPVPDGLADLVEQPGTIEARAASGRLHQARTTLFGDNGRISVISDITEQSEAQARLARSERLALIGQMLAQITHEVRNPLNALSLNAELLSDELEQLDPDHNTEAWDLLAIVSSEIERLTGVTEHYLQLVRRPTAQIHATDLGELIRNTGALLRAELEQSDVVLHTTIAHGPPQMVDKNQIRQALLNAMRNAVEAGSKKIEITLRYSDDEIALSVTDDGQGMSPESMNQATDPFFSTKPKGTGLGLAITRQILEEHNGRLRLDPVVPRGTRLTLMLPRRDAPETELSDAPEEVA